MIGTQREDDTAIMEEELAFLLELEDFMNNYLGERGQRWQEENEITQSEQAIPPQQLPNNLA